jgi:anhydro-N-acetylmuramic acid kinase
MNKDSYKVLGVMSGTSLDGIDLAECYFSVSEAGQWNYKIGVAKTIPYPPSWKAVLREAIEYPEPRLLQLNKDYTQFLSQVISEFIDNHKIDQLDAVCSHGHTILHRPYEGLTLQIGNLPELARWIGQTVVCDFRVQDVELGGQGAPLVPIGDRLLFSDYDFCLNLGGFANCSFEKGGKRIAYDICPVNIVLNRCAELLGHPYDEGGRLAASGTLDSELFKALNALPYYREEPPKSLGLEWVDDEVFPLLEATNNSAQTILNTFTEHIAFQLAAQFRERSTVLVTGGGAYNDYLLQRVAHHKKVELLVPESKLLEFKEALIFGLLGVLKLRGEINCLASVTGAEKDHSSGVIF